MSTLYGPDGQILQAFSVLEPTWKPGDTWSTFRRVRRLLYLNGRAVTFAEAKAVAVAWSESKEGTKCPTS